MSADEGDIIFTGGSAQEAEAFIFTVKRRAYSKGKYQDNGWIVEFASLCFAGKALRWYEMLDEETQNDWRLLKRAILDEYKEASIPSPIVPTSAASIQSLVSGAIPAATPPLRRGRIRVECDYNALRGYIAKSFHDTNWCIVSTDQNNASIFEFDASARTIKFQGDNNDSYLVPRAYEPNWDLQKGSYHCAAMMKNTGRTACAKSGWSNSIQIDLWSVDITGKLSARWKLGTGGFWELEASGLTSNSCIYLIPDYNAFSGHYGTDYKALTLYFDPVP